MALTPDEQKALEHIAQERRREAFQRFLQSKLVAPPGPRLAVLEGFKPLLQRRRDP